MLQFWRFLEAVGPGSRLSKAFFWQSCAKSLLLGQASGGLEIAEILRAIQAIPIMEVPESVETGSQAEDVAPIAEPWLARRATSFLPVHHRLQSSALSMLNKNGAHRCLSACWFNVDRMCVQVHWPHPVSQHPCSNVYDIPLGWLMQEQACAKSVLSAVSAKAATSKDTELFQSGLTAAGDLLIEVVF